MKGITGLMFALLVVGLIAGCEPNTKSGKGFAFPAGDAARGQAAFVELKCFTCHRVDGIGELPEPTAASEMVVLLGGEVGRVRTYGDLVTSIIHPSYRISEKLQGPKRWELKGSPMPAANDEMTVTQMLDIVTYLQPHYRKLERTTYQQPYEP